MRVRHVLLLAAATMLSFGGGAQAAPLMPSFAGVPTGWFTDRYDPHSFSNVGSYQGRSNVLGIEINTDEGFGSRNPCCNFTFYNTQGRQHAAVGGAGSDISADLFVPKSWGDAANGSRRSDMWGVMTDGTSVSDYPIIGFTNYGGAPRYRVWEENIGNWIDLLTPVTYDAWTALRIDFTGTSYQYFINGSLVNTDTTINGSTGFQDLIMQAYNFTGDPSLTGAVGGDPNGNYIAHWSNTQTKVPEPGSLPLFAAGLLGFAALYRRREQVSPKIT